MEADLVLELARAVARSDNARSLNPDNTAGARLRLHDAVASTRAFFVTPRPDLLVIDLDLPDDATRSADLLAALDLLLDAARRAGVPCVQVPSGRPGHAHAYLVTGSGPARTRLEVWAKDAGLDVRTRGIRPPGTPHRRGGVPALAAPHQVMTTLQAGVDASATTRLAAQLCPVRLPGRVQTAVRHGYSHAGYASPSHARMALAVAVRARGGSTGLLHTILRDQTSPLGATFRARDARWQHAELARLWDKAGTWIANGGRADPRTHLRRVARAAAGARWSGSAGGSDLSVLEALLAIGDRVRAKVVGAALPDLAAQAGVSTDTARAAVRRLQAAGWLAVVASETALTTRTYELRIPPTVDLDPGGDADAGATAGALVALGDLGGDVARRGALGKVTVRVARALQDATSGLLVSEVAARLSMTRASVRYHLRKLEQVGWLRRSGARVSVDVTLGQVKDLARAFGVHGARARQLELVARARELRAAARAVLRSLRPRTSRPGNPRRSTVTCLAPATSAPPPTR